VYVFDVVCANRFDVSTIKLTSSESSVYYNKILMVSGPMEELVLKPDRLALVQKHLASFLANLYLLHEIQKTFQFDMHMS